MTQKLRTPFKKNHGRITLVLYNRPSDCGGRCIYCVSDEGVTKSVVRNQDTLMARECDWDPVCQLQKRFGWYGLKKGCGNKFGLAVKGGSFTNHDRDYLFDYFKAIYDFLNDEVSPTFDQAKLLQKDAPDRIVQIQVETRPDFINRDWCEYLLKLGVTTVQIGVQSLDDTVLEINNRGHDVQTVVEATRLLRQYGFEVGYHIMVGMVGSSIDLDIETLSYRLWEENFSPDVLKIYPCILLKDSNCQKELARHVNVDWVPLTDETYHKLLLECYPHIPPYVHINRIQRIFDPSVIALGPKKVIDRQVYSGISRCFRQRSVAQSDLDLDGDFTDFTVRTYRQTKDDYCVEAIVRGNVVVGYARISFPRKSRSIIRDVRVLGNMLPVGKGPVGRKGTQHIGIGKSMMQQMEQLAAEKRCSTIILHPADGTRAYFELLGYFESDNYYLEKKLSHNLGGVYEVR